LLRITEKQIPRNCPEDKTHTLRPGGSSGLQYNRLEFVFHGFELPKVFQQIPGRGVSVDAGDIAVVLELRQAAQITFPLYFQVRPSVKNT